MSATMSSVECYAGKLIGMCFFCLLVSTSALCLAADIEFNRDVRPILSDNCFSCHGPDARHREADLRLDVRDDAIASKAIVPGDLKASQLIERIRSSDPDKLMPPKDSHKKLNAEQIRVLENWIQSGAEYQLHWAYEPPRKAKIESGKHPIDALVSAMLISKGLSFSPEADRRTLIRRLAMDLTGLPPSPARVAQFVADKSPQAYETLVDELLASPHYGERMAIGWLDAVRFADTIGYHSDNPRNIWPYRDWVIDSFNKNKSFRRFTQEQIAGDLLPDANESTRIGSAFNRLLLSTEEGGAQPKDYEARMLTDRVRAIGTAWLGQTTGCSQCHDHKFDPITMRDFYSLGAFFADIKEPIVGQREEGLILGTPSQLEEIARLRAELDNAKKLLAKDKANVQAKEAVRKATDELSKLTGPLPKCLVSESMPEPRIVRILPRGNWMDETGEVVQPALPRYFPQPEFGGRKLTRLDLADWLVSRENPLTARAVINRLWKQFFGAGISRVLEDLGAQGEPPTNPQLLDWLACEFMDSDWDIKHMVRLIVTSRTYRQSSVATPEAIALDPYNRLLGRQSAFRVDAELVRDNALAVSGLLVARIGGPSVKPYQPDGYWENLNFPTRDYVADRGPEQYRRGLYVWWQRSFLHPSLLAFDAPSREECAADRSRSNIPQQALVLLNDPTYVEAAINLASRALDEIKTDDASRIEWCWQQVLQRSPTKDEATQLRKLLDAQRSHYRDVPQQAAELVTTGQLSLPPQVDKIELAAWTHVTRVLLNLHETITRS